MFGRAWVSHTLQRSGGQAIVRRRANLSVTFSVEHYRSAVMSSVDDEAGEKYCAHRGPYRNDDTANDTRG